MKRCVCPSLHHLTHPRECGFSSAPSPATQPHLHACLLQQCSGTPTTRAQWHTFPLGPASPGPGPPHVLGPMLLLRTVFGTCMFSCGGTPLFSTWGPRGHTLRGQWDAVPGHLGPTAPCITCHQDASSSSSSTHVLRTQFHRLVPTQMFSLKPL